MYDAFCIMQPPRCGEHVCSHVFAPFGCFLPADELGGVVYLCTKSAAPLGGNQGRGEGHINQETGERCEERDYFRRFMGWEPYLRQLPYRARP